MSREAGQQLCGDWLARDDPSRAFVARSSDGTHLNTFEQFQTHFNFVSATQASSYSTGGAAATGLLGVPLWLASLYTLAAV